MHVSYDDFEYGLKRLKKDFEREVGKKLADNIHFHDIDREDLKVELAVSWSTIGIVDIESARAFAEALVCACDMADAFPYNGFTIEY